MKNLKILSNSEINKTRITRPRNNRSINSSSLRPFNQLLGELQEGNDSSSATFARLINTLSVHSREVWTRRQRVVFTSSSKSCTGDSWHGFSSRYLAGLTRGLRRRSPLTYCNIRRRSFRKPWNRSRSNGCTWTGNFKARRRANERPTMGKTDLNSHYRVCPGTLSRRRQMLVEDFPVNLRETWRWTGARRGVPSSLERKICEISEFVEVG